MKKFKNTHKKNIKTKNHRDNIKDKIVLMMKYMNNVKDMLDNKPIAMSVLYRFY